MSDKKTAYWTQYQLTLLAKSIARGYRGKPITGKNAQARARNFLDELGIDWKIDVDIAEQEMEEQ